MSEKLFVRRAVLPLLLAACCVGCNPTPPADNSCDTDGIDLTGTTRGGFVYVLQPDEELLDQIGQSTFDYVVIEPSLDGSADGELSPAAVAVLQSSAACDRVVLAYLSIGEAETYRDYFDPEWIGEEGRPVDGVAPAWLGPFNPEFPDNFKVRYWDADWQTVVLEALDRIIDAGYDGVYLDIIDAYEYFSSEEGGDELTRLEARTLMIDFVARIADHARTTQGATSFLVFPQNGSDIILSDDGELDTPGEEYLATIDGIGIEDLYFDELEAVPFDEFTERVERLALYTAREKVVLVTDYVLPAAFKAEQDDTRVLCFYTRSLRDGFLPYAAIEDRDLDEIVELTSADWSVRQPPVACATE